jgi:hypothetical protein
MIAPLSIQTAGLSALFFWSARASFQTIALIGDTSELDAGAAGEHLGGHLADGARYKAIVDLAGIGLGVGNQFGRRARRQRRMHRQHARLPTDQPDRSELLTRIVAGIGIERRIDTERAGIG